LGPRNQDTLVNVERQRAEMRTSRRIREWHAAQQTLGGRFDVGKFSRGEFALPMRRRPEARDVEHNRNEIPRLATRPWRIRATKTYRKRIKHLANGRERQTHRLVLSSCRLPVFSTHFSPSLSSSAAIRSASINSPIPPSSIRGKS